MQKLLSSNAIFISVCLKDLKTGVSEILPNHITMLEIM